MVTTVRMIALTVLLSMQAVQVAAAAEVRVLSTGIFRGMYPAIIAQFERSSGHKIKLQIETPFALRDKLLAGTDTDVVIAVTPIMKDIENSGKIISESRTAIGEVYIAGVVRSGASHPSFSTADAVKQSIRSARAVAINDPKGGSNVGRFVMGLADRFAFDDELRSRLKMYPGGGDKVAHAVVDGEADFGITISSEILAVKGTEIAGRLPPDMNQVNVAYGFLTPGSKDPEAARAFLAFLRSPEVQAIMISNGVEPK